MLIVEKFSRGRENGIDRLRNGQLRRRHATQSSINQTGMDFVTEISFCKTLPRLLLKKGWFLEVESQLGKSVKVSG